MCLNRRGMLYTDNGGKKKNESILSAALFVIEYNQLWVQ